VRRRDRTDKNTDLKIVLASRKYYGISKVQISFQRVVKLTDATELPALDSSGQSDYIILMSTKICVRTGFTALWRVVGNCVPVRDCPVLATQPAVC
jgi:hypothetical protein